MVIIDSSLHWTMLGHIIMDLEIFVTAHKQTKQLEHPLLSYIQGGAELNKKIKAKYYDNAGEDNISIKSPTFCELTTQYWVWKNLKRDYYGFCHYRRFLSFQEINCFPEDRGGNILFEEINPSLIDKLGMTDIEHVKNLVSGYDILVTNPYDCSVDGISNLYWQYKMGRYLHIKDLECMFSVIQELYPEYMEAAKASIDSSIFYPCNMFIMNDETFQTYNQWVFDILNEVEKRTDISEYNEQERRVFGHIAERLLCIFIEYSKRNTSRKIGIIKRSFVRDTDDYPSPAFENNNVPIVLASDNEYALYAAATINSIITNASDKNNYDLLLMTPDMSETNKDLIKSLCNSHNNVSLRIIDVSAKLKTLDLSVEDHISVVTYARLFAPILFVNYPKFLYLDVDLIVKSDVAELYNIDIQDNILGACIDIGYVSLIHENDKETVKAMETAQIKDPYKYFNAGVLIVNNTKLSEEYPNTYLIDYATTHQYRYMDQDILNELCANKIFYLGYEWNVMHYLSGHRKDLIDRAAPMSFKQGYLAARKHPKIIHYAGNKKPWNNFYEDYADEFWNSIKNSILHEILFEKYLENKYLKDKSNKVKFSKRLANRIHAKYE